MPKISVILICFNGAAYLPETIESLQAQSFRAWEMVCVDDGSTDDSRHIMDGYAAGDPRLKIISQPNAGISAARNRGQEESDWDAPYLLFLDGDDVMLPNALYDLSDALDRCPEAVAAAGKIQTCIDAGGAPCEPPWPLPETRTGLWDFARLTASPHGMGLYPASIQMYRRWAFHAAGGYDSLLRDVEDDDLNGRVALHGPFLMTGLETVLYRRHGGNASANTERIDGVITRRMRPKQAMYRQAWERQVRRGRK